MATTEATSQVKRTPTAITLHVYYMADGFDEGLDEAALDNLFKAFAESKLQGTTPNRFGFVSIRRYNAGVLYGYFAHEYARELLDYDESKAEVRRDEGDFVRYAFILDVSSRYLYLHRRQRPYPTIPEWQTVFGRLVDQLRYLVRTVDLTPPFQIEPLTEGESRQEFVDAFFSTANEIKYVELEDFDLSLLPENFHFFNPKEQFDAAFREGIADTVPLLRRAAMVAKPNGNLQKTPVVRGLMATSAKPQKLRLVHKDTKTTRTLQAEKDVVQETTLEIEGFSAEEVTAVLERMQGVIPSARARERGPAALPEGQAQLFPTGTDNDAPSR